MPTAPLSSWATHVILRRSGRAYFGGPRVISPYRLVCGSASRNPSYFFWVPDLFIQGGTGLPSLADGASLVAGSSFFAGAASLAGAFSSF